MPTYVYITLHDINFTVLSLKFFIFIIFLIISWKST